MKKGLLLIPALMILCLLNAQVSLKTIVTQGPVVAGESFQVQYVLEDEGSEADFFQPDFKPFRVISGPNAYAGVNYGDKGAINVKNITFTLLATKEGLYAIPAASVKVGGQIVRSQPASLQVISKASAIARGILSDKTPPAEGTYLAPGEDPIEKMRKNIFMKVSVDRKTCYVGQPVTATFKLYSRLNSHSDIVKNPGFYGFAIQEMIGLGDRITATEVVNGKKFEVHTIRKVQLYPLSAGTFTIDPMEVQNKVEFSTSSVVKRTEQEIVEGVMPTEDELFSKPGFKLAETSMRTEPVTVKVTALPDTNRPASFNGATGKFSIAATLEEDEIGTNREGDLLVTVSGKGNFLQLAAPAVNWPANMEGFAPEIRDTLHKEVSPLEGKRIFRFRFISTKPGEYTIPAISFCFFDPDSNRYRTASTNPLVVKISKGEATEDIKAEMSAVKPASAIPAKVWIGGGLVLCLVIVMFAVRKMQKTKRKPVEQPVLATPRPGITELLKPVTILLQADETTFYTALRNAIWDFAGQQFGLTGSLMNKRALMQELDLRQVAEVDQQSILRILDTCETGMFTGASAITDKQQLLEETRHVMLKIAGLR
ncbi:BatD family protein [Terrimonas sp. NA20]|uniref:BatD family protein n=1 Tax=Terrimonas ginsenosidimutans TaxID=2908004 RepID=A0ABS9KZ70_9BACT|nr:BatD family protein [Terrimonas ginsenosidimutans]MCG2617610.1 BatD family protein [Terrimonas ginsenosidimutans]